MKIVQKLDIYVDYLFNTRKNSTNLNIQIHTKSDKKKYLYFIYITGRIKNIGIL